MNIFMVVVIFLIVARWAAQFWLERFNHAHVLRHAEAVPESFRGIIDPATYARSVEYTLAKGRFHQWETAWSNVVLLTALLSGILPWTFGLFASRFGVF